MILWLSFLDLSKKVYVYIDCICQWPFQCIQKDQIAFNIEFIHEYYRTCQAFKSGLSLVLIRSQVIISDKKFDILSWKNEMCVFLTC